MMVQKYSKEKIKTYLFTRQKLLSLSAIGRSAGIPNLTKWVNNYTDGKGSQYTLADKYLPALQKQIDFIKAK